MRSAALLSLSLSDLEQIIQRRKKDLRRLMRHRRQAEAALQKIDREIARIGGNASTRGGRARNAAPLASMIESSIQSAGKPLSISEIIEQVTRRGYQSSSGNFRSVVSLTLIKDTRFKKVERGVYGLKGTGVSAEEKPKQAPKRRKKRKSSTGTAAGAAE